MLWLDKSEDGFVGCMTLLATIEFKFIKPTVRNFLLFQLDKLSLIKGMLKKLILSLWWWGGSVGAFHHFFSLSIHDFLAILDHKNVSCIVPPRVPQAHPLPKAYLPL